MSAVETSTSHGLCDVADVAADRLTDGFQQHGAATLEAGAAIPVLEHDAGRGQQRADVRGGGRHPARAREVEEEVVEELVLVGPEPVRGAAGDTGRLTISSIEISSKPIVTPCSRRMSFAAANMRSRTSLEGSRALRRLRGWGSSVLMPSIFQV